MYIARRLLAPRDLDSAPPPAQDAVANNPTLLVSWWCTMFALVIILVRLCGRWIRTEKLFVEDKIMALSIVPLLARMGCAHLVIRWGTNNAVTEGLTPDEIWQREIGSQLVLPARILYAAFLWTAKLTIAEFLRRLYSSMWKRSWEVTIHAIRWFLGLTFAAVVVATLTECRPFAHYWQVVPDPGPHCRQGFGQLIAMGVSDTITDLVLVAFPVPVILASHMPLARKISLVLLFALSLSLVAITIYRVTATIDRQANQQFRSLVASFEILAAAAVANALVLASFVRDRGAKKAKYKYARGGEWGALPTSFGADGADRDGSLERPAPAKARAARAASWGSDTDLVGDLGIRLGPEFRAARRPCAAPPVPATLPPPAAPRRRSSARPPPWPQRAPPSDASSSDDEDREDPRPADPDAPPAADAPGEPDVLTPRRMAFFDVGGLLDASAADACARAASTPAVAAPPGPRRSSVARLGFGAVVGGVPEGQPEDARLRACKSA